MGSWALGQALLNIAPPAEVTLFLIGSLLISAAVVPITLLPSHPPIEVQKEAVAFRDLLSVSPLASIGVFLGGMAMGGFWGMGPIFAQRIGLDVGGISAFMGAVLGVTLLLQWPLGWLSDRVARNLIIAGAALASAVAAIGVAVAGDAPLPLLLAAGALFGGFGIPIYSLCVAVANDDLPAGRLLGTARGLLLLNGIGSAVGPVIGGSVMNLAGPGSLFLYAAVLMGVIAALAITRRKSSRPTEGRAIRCTSSPMITGGLDTRLTGHPERSNDSDFNPSGYRQQPTPFRSLAVKL
jgi:MFS family permease